MNQAIIGGTGIYKLFDQLESRAVETPYGSVQVDIAEIDGIAIAFLPRHGRDHSIPPHRINYRANILALRELGVEYVYATAAVGSCSERFAPGDVVVLGDFLDFTKSRPTTFFEDSVRHALMSEPYCVRLS
ncbi:MAG TPA: MTAP family purine nucleoside phosphorylase, partial [Magnetospirillaceae bacterium]|nr:MTAP family purine nucleoside phosphorylase [Magnetospirillaceae bacterium]